MGKDSVDTHLTLIFKERRTSLFKSECAISKNVHSICLNIFWCTANLQTVRKETSYLSFLVIYIEVQKQILKMFTDQQLTGKSGHANIFCLGAVHIHLSEWDYSKNVNSIYLGIFWCTVICNLYSNFLLECLGNLSKSSKTNS